MLRHTLCSLTCLRQDRALHHSTNQTTEQKHNPQFTFTDHFPRGIAQIQQNFTNRKLAFLISQQKPSKSHYVQDQYQPLAKFAFLYHTIPCIDNITKTYTSALPVQKFIAIIPANNQIGCCPTSRRSLLFIILKFELIL